MNHLAIDVSTRTHAGVVSRRASLASLGTIGLAALANSLAVNAKKSKSLKKAKRKCKQQIGQCTTLIVDACGGESECLEQVTCCEFVGRCDMTGFLNCLDT